MKKSRRILPVVFGLMICFVVQLALPTMATAATNYTDNIMQTITEMIQDPIPIDHLEIYGECSLDFEYNEHGHRISKRLENVETTYTYERGKLIYEQGPQHTIRFQYVNDDEKCSSIIYDEVQYYFQYDAYGNVEYITDENFIPICRYEYSGPIATCFEYVNGNWIKNTEKLFIGNLNPIRYQGWYYDVESCHYHLGGGIYYNPETNNYVMNEFTVKPNCSRRGTYYNEAINSTIGLLSLDSYNQYIEQVTQSEWNSGQRWYDSLGGESIVARCIYAENFHPSATEDRKAILRVIVNRFHQNVASSIRAVVTQPGQFTTINPSQWAINGSSNARAAKNPTSEAWKNATFLACIVSLTANISTLGNELGWPAGIDTQMNFYGLDSVYNNLSLRNGKLYYGNMYMKDAAIAGYGKLNTASATSVSALLSRFYGNNRYNIFFTMS